MASFAAASEILGGAVLDGAFPACAIEVGTREGALWRRAFGSLTYDAGAPPASIDTIFDLASLTKVLATTTLAMRAVDEGRLSTSDPVSRWIPAWRGRDREEVTIADLLAHASGLTAYLPFFRDCTGRIEFERAICSLPLEYRPRTQSLYSDLGFILLGGVVELLAQLPLDRFVHERIVRPLGLRSTAFVDLTQLRTRRIATVPDVIAPTERCPWRGKVLCGEVHDDNAWAMGGVAGHSGLFANAADVDTLAGRLLGCLRGRDDFVPQEIVREFWTKDGTAEDSTWALGWDTPSATTSSAGGRMSRHAVGHLGFTGTSIWIDLDRDLRVTLLTNRTHPRRDNERIRDARPRIHDAVMEVFGT